MQIRDFGDDGVEPAEIAGGFESRVTVEEDEAAIGHYEKHHAEPERVNEHRDRYWPGVIDGSEWTAVRWSPPVNGSKTDMIGLLEAGEDDDG